MKGEGGGVHWLKIRRLYCRHCESLHNELPDCLLPYKHYQSEVVSGVLDEVVCPDDLDSEDHPCADTMALWIEWFRRNLQEMEGWLRRAAEMLRDLSEQRSDIPASLLGHLRKDYPDWLEQAVRTVYNSGGHLMPFYR